MPRNVRPDRSCEYLPGGVCTIHGGGAVRHWRPIGKTCMRGDNGEMKWKTERETYYVCDVGEDRKRKMKQTKLSFSVVGRTEREEDTKKGDLGTSNTSEGQ